MSIFKELNDIKLDVSEFEETALSEHEEKRLLKRVHQKLTPRKTKRKWLGVSMVLVAATMLSISLTLDKGTIASMPFVSKPIEKYINEINTPDYSPYKTAIGETTENDLGKLTLNEVMMDDQKLFLSATFEPAEHVEFDYQTVITPKVKINGEDYTFTTGSQSIEINNEMFAIYNDIKFTQPIETENVTIELSYDTWDSTTAVDEPWTFQTVVSQKKLLDEKKVYEMEKEITLINGEVVTIEKIVATPISATIYFDLSQSSTEEVNFRIESANGIVHEGGTSYRSNESGEISYTEYDSLGEGYYFLVAYNANDGTVLSEPIPIN